MLNIYYSHNENVLKYSYKEFINNKDFYIINADQLSIDDIILQLTQTNLFSDANAYVINNADFLLKNDIQLDELLNLESDINLFVLSDGLESFNKKLQKNKKVSFNKLSSFSNSSKNDIINSLLAKNNVSFDSIDTKQYFIDNIISDPFHIENEINKLSSYSNKPISMSELTEVIIFDNTMNIFDLIKYILTNNKKNAIFLYEKLISNNNDPIMIFNMLVTQLFALKLLKQANNKGLDSLTIENELGIKKFSQINNNKIIYNVSMEKINALFSSLIELDINIKDSSIDKYLGLKTIILTYGK
jgi:DNA polymerase-3 subunit delta